MMLDERDINLLAKYANEIKWQLTIYIDMIFTKILLTRHALNLEI